jgi:hypothetical protein
MADRRPSARAARPQTVTSRTCRRREIPGQNQFDLRAVGKLDNGLDFGALRYPGRLAAGAEAAQAVAVATLVCALWLDMVSIAHLECTDHVDQVWTDVRPRSLRDQMAFDHQ